MAKHTDALVAVAEERSLGKIPSYSVRNPKPLLQLFDEYGNDTVLRDRLSGMFTRSGRPVLLLIERAFQYVYLLEDLLLYLTSTEPGSAEDRTYQGQIHMALMKLLRLLEVPHVLWKKDGYVSAVHASDYRPCL